MNKLHKNDPTNSILRTNKTSRRNLIRERFLDSILTWEVNHPKGIEASQSFKNKEMTMKSIKKTMLPKQKTERVRYPKPLKPDEFLSVIQRHKWLESEKAGCDIGMESALNDWIFRFGKKTRIRSQNLTK